MARHVDPEPETGGRCVAYWRISSGRIVAVLFESSHPADYHYRTDAGGGAVTVPVVDILLGSADDSAIGYLSPRVALNYASAKMHRGPVTFQVTR